MDRAIMLSSTAARMRCTAAILPRLALAYPMALVLMARASKDERAADDHRRDLTALMLVYVVIQLIRPAHWAHLHSLYAMVPMNSRCWCDSGVGMTSSCSASSCEPLLLARLFSVVFWRSSSRCNALRVF